MPKDLFLKVRVTKSERDQLHMVARQNGKTLSGFIRSLTQQPMESSLNKNG
jgi:uncharacterized protein (DUF1778 family)